GGRAGLVGGPPGGDGEGAANLKPPTASGGGHTPSAAPGAGPARLPKEIAAIHAAIETAKKDVEATRTRLDVAKKEQRGREKDLEVVQAKRSKTEGRLYEVKTNKENSAVLAEIEEIKQEKARVEEEILGLMETQEHR